MRSKNLLLLVGLLALPLIVWLLPGAAQGPPQPAGRPAGTQDPARPGSPTALRAREDADGGLPLLADGEEPGRVEAAAARGDAIESLLPGRVHWPAGAPGSGEVHAHLVEGRRTWRELTLAGTRDAPAPWQVASVRVGPDGRFELPLPAEVAQPHLLVLGDAVHQEESLRIWPGRSLEVHPGPAGRLEVRVAGPEGEQRSGRVVLRIETETFTPGDLSPGLLEVELPLEGGRAAIGGVPAGKGLQVLAASPGLAARLESVPALFPGEVRDLTLGLDAGGTLRGRVVDGSGAPVPGATVEALLPGRTFGFDDPLAGAATCDGEGTFVLEHAPAGSLRLRATAPGRLESRKLTVQLAVGGTSEELELVLRDGERIVGRVLAPDGAPAPGARVEASFDPAFLAGPSALGALTGADGSALADGEGRFTLAGLGPGPFVVHASRGDDRTRRDGVRPADDELVLTLAPAAGLRGRLVAATGEELELAGFDVLAVRVGEGSMGPVGLEQRRVSSDDPRGRFLVPDLGPGTWQLHARAPGWASPEPRSATVPGEEQELELPVVRTAAVRGRVLAADGTPVSGAIVEVDDGRPEWMRAMQQGPPSPRARSGEEGRFVLVDLLPGELGLAAEAEGHCRGPVQALELEPGQELVDLELTLGLGGTLTGEVYDGSGEPAGGRLVTLNSMATLRTVVERAAADGTFRIDDLEPGTWQVIAMDGSSDWSGSDPGDLGAMMQSMQLSQAVVVAGEVTHVVLGAPAADPVRVHGRVSRGGEPYRGAVVSFYPSGAKLYERLRFTSVDDEGRYELTVDGPGEYVVYVQLMPGGVAQQQTIEYLREVPAGVDEHRLDLEVPRGRITGTVLGPGGDPVAGARITLAVEGGSRSDQLFGGQYVETATAADGSYDVDGLRPGTYRLSAGGAALLGASGSEPGRVTRAGLRLAEGEWLEGVDFRLPAPGAIEVRVVDGSGAPVAGAHVFPRDSGGRVTEPFSIATTDGTGRLRLPGLAPGDYTLVARRGALASQESPAVRVVADGTARAELRLEEGVVLWIRLTDREEGEEVRATVRVLDEQGREVTGLFGMEDLENLYMKGGFSPTEHRVGPLAPGRYRVEATTTDGRNASKPVTLRAGDLERKLRLRLE